MSVQKRPDGGRPKNEPHEPSERLFFALWPDETQRSALVRAAGEAVRACGGRPVAVASLHVTLAFLGSVPVRRMPVVQWVAQRMAFALVEPMPLTFDHLEHWPKPQVLCAASSVASPLAAILARQLQKLTLEAGFAPDIKPFRQHITLARKVPQLRRADLPTGHGGHGAPMQAVTWTMNGFALIASRTDSAGPLYSVVESYSLYGGCPP